MPYHIKDEDNFYRLIAGGSCLFLVHDSSGRIDPAYVDLLAPTTKYTDLQGYSVINFTDGRGKKQTFRIVGQEYIDLQTVYSFLDSSRFSVA